MYEGLQFIVTQALQLENTGQSDHNGEDFAV